MPEDERRRSPYDTKVGTALSGELARRRMKQTDLAKSLGRSVAYTNQVMTGRKGASPEWVDLVADTMDLSDVDRQKLHHAAAVDAGFKLDLTKP